MTLRAMWPCLTVTMMTFSRRIQSTVAMSDWTFLSLCREMRDEVRARLLYTVRARLQQVCRQLSHEDPGLALPAVFRPYMHILPLAEPAFRWFLRDWHAAGMQYAPPHTRVINLTTTKT